MVGVNVRVDDILDRHPCLLRDAQVRRRRVDWIDDDGRRLAASPKQVGRSDDGIGVKKLAKDHGTSRK